MSDNPLVNLVREVRQAVQAAQTEIFEQGITISLVDIQLKTTAKRDGGGDLGFKFEPLGIDVGLGGKIAKGDVHTISLSLVPAPLSMELESTPSEELVGAMKAISGAVQEALGSQQDFALREATVELNFGITKEGKAKFSIFSGVTGNMSDEAIQTIKLKLEGPGAKKKESRK
jgi:hypothetical protein